MGITIGGLSLAVARLPLVHEFETSSHRKAFLDHIIIRAEATDGANEWVGWGECASPSAPHYCAETTETCWHILLEYLAPLVIGREWDTPSDVSRLLGRVTGNHFARAGLEMACWDLFAQSQQLPLARALGPQGGPRVEAGVSLGVERDVEALLQQVNRHVADGYRRVKLKIRPGWDERPVEAVRGAFPDLQLQVDANGAYSSDAVSSLLVLDQYDLLMIEQPFAADDLLGHADLARRLETPVCLDESVPSLGALHSALALRACDVVNIKVSRLGGLTEAVAVHDVCLDAGVPVWCGGMHEFGVGRAANLALASLPGFRLPSDISGSDKYYAHDIIEPAIRADNGLVDVPLARPGIGVTVIEERLAAATLRWQFIGDRPAAPPAMWEPAGGGRDVVATRRS